MAGDLLLSVQDLTFRYRDREAPSIRDISLELAPGEVLLVAGASGCGKTTLARCINGLAPRSYKGELQGRVLVDGSDTSGWSLARISERVGTVLQDPERQILGSRVMNEVAFGLENLALPRREILERANQAMDHLGIAGLSERETFSLSGGEKQKVALAGVLAMRPSILLLDEPLASLDPASAQETMALVRRLADEGMAVLLIEHRVEDVLKIRPTRVLFMEDGRVRFAGPVAGLQAAVDYRQVKLPASMVIARAAQETAPPPPPARAMPAGIPGEPVVVFEGVSFAYGDGPRVLHEIDLEIRSGDVIAVLGANGAGKTTLVKHAIGLHKPTAGRVLVAGRDTRQLSVAQTAATIGYVFQSPSHMLFAPTVRQELSFGPANLGHPPAEIDEEVNEALKTVNLEGLEQDPPLALSFGQQKRVSIAAILAMRSKILAMDEPTAGQDYRNYTSFMDSIMQMPGFTAMLFITHDVDLAVVYATRVLLLNEGRIAADGPPEQVLSDTGLLTRCRVVPTSLLQANLDRLPQTGRFLRAEALAHA